MARSFYDDEPLLKARKPRDMRPRTECPLCLERAIVLAILPAGDGLTLLYVNCPKCDFCGEVEERAA